MYYKIKVLDKFIKCNRKMFIWWENQKYQKLPFKNY